MSPCPGEDIEQNLTPPVPLPHQSLSKEFILNIEHKFPLL